MDSGEIRAYLFNDYLNELTNAWFYVCGIRDPEYPNKECQSRVRYFHEVYGHSKESVFGMLEGLEDPYLVEQTLLLSYNLVDRINEALKQADAKPEVKALVLDGIKLLDSRKHMLGGWMEWFDFVEEAGKHSSEPNL